MATQECVLFISRLQDSSYLLSLFLTHYVGSVQGNSYTLASDLTSELSRLGVPAGDQAAILGLAPSGCYVVSDLQVDDAFAQNLGIELHDGDMPDEPNQIVFTRVSGENQDLIVDILLNNRKRGRARWLALKTCLGSYSPNPGGNAGFTEADLTQIETDLKTPAGKSVVPPSNGAENQIVMCIKGSRVHA